MAYKMFAAIYVGSSELVCSIYAINAKKSFSQVDTVSHIIELGRDTYKSGAIKTDSLLKVCEVLNGFRRKMKEYQVTEYRAYATSAIREAENRVLALEYIRRNTGLDVSVLSNSEQRYMIFKGLVAKQKEFHQVISKNTAIVDVGAGSVQVSLFDKNNLIVTENLHIGAVRVRDYLALAGNRTGNMDQVITEYVDSDIETFRSMYLNDKEIKNIIAVGEVVDTIKHIIPDLTYSEKISREQFEKMSRILVTKTPQQLSEKYGIPFERATLMQPALIIYQSFLNNCKAEEIYAPNVDFCDGIVSSYMDEGKRVVFDHNFEDDIVATAQSMNKRYRCNRAHTDKVAELSLMLYDSMKKLHGMGKKERLQLQIAAILHECGNFINLHDGALNSYYIVANTEIIGLSHKERMEIANIIKYNLYYLPSMDAITKDLDGADYVTIAKLSAILRIANVLDKSHTQKIKDVSVSFKDEQMVISVKTYEDLSLESGLFEKRADFFEQVYGIRPVLRLKKGA